MKIILKNNKRQQSKLKLKVIKILIGIAIFFCLSIPFVYIVSITLAKVAVIEFILAVMPQEKLSGINILAFGVDETEYVQRADSIIVCHINEENNRMGILSIPRDTRVHVSGYGLTKINHAHAFGGVDLLKKSVSDFLGVPIDYYIKVNLNGVEKVIDKIGGVVVNIPKDLFYVDYAGDLYIDLKKGQQRLTGKEAVQFLRFRHDADGDYGRIARQQTFIKALVSKVTKSGKLFEMPLLFAKLSSNIKTNLGLAQMVGFATQCKDIFDAGNIEIATVPGAPILYKGVSYLRPDIVAMDNLIKETVMVFKSM